MAGNYTYGVTLDTSSLVAHPAAPFSLEFQLLDGLGIGDANNTALVWNFKFGGGAAVGAPTLTGGATGDLTSSVHLVDNTFYTEFRQTFTPGSTLSFAITLTTNVDPGGVPDQFSFAIFDAGGIEVPTLGPADQFLSIDIDSATPVALGYGSDTSRSLSAGGPASVPSPVVLSGVPEPGSALLLASGIGLLALARRRFSN